MRAYGFLLLVLGLVASVVGTVSGVSSLVAWDGRRPIDERSLGPAPSASTWEAGSPQIETFIPNAGRHYSLSVQVVFDRASVREEEGLAQVVAQMPLVVRVKDGAGRSLADLAAWLDPNQPPNALYGRASHASSRGPAPELVAERIIGPFASSTKEPVTVEIDLGPDRVGAARVLSRRLVIHDDSLAPTLWKAGALAGVGAVAAMGGVGLVAAAWWKGRGRKRKRDIASPAVV